MHRGRVALFQIAIAATIVAARLPAHADDEVEAFRVYTWSSFETADSETQSNCRAIDRNRGEVGWAVPRREVVDVSELASPEEQQSGDVYRVFVDYCVHTDASRERPVGSMTFRVARLKDPKNVQRWGVRHYKKTAKVKSKKSKPVREHFDPPQFDAPG